MYSNLDEAFAKWIQSLLDKNHILGASVAVVDDGNVESAGYGFAQLPDVACTADTIYRMASTSKAIGAAVMGLVLEDEAKNTIVVDGKTEKLTWSTPIIKVLGEDFDFRNDAFNKNVTIEDALSNRSGVSGHDYNFGPWMGKDTRKYVRSLRHIDAVTTPIRTTFQYTNTMFAVIGHIIEKIDGKSFDEAARDRLWKPLGMTSTFAALSALTALEGNNKHRLARGYYWAIDEESKDKESSTQPSEIEHGHYVAEAHLDFDLVGPAAAVLSTANDYSKWITALLDASNASKEGKPDESKTKIISHKLFDELTTARTLVIPSGIPSIGKIPKHPRIIPQLYSLGWLADSQMFAGQTILNHPGGCQGFGSHVFLLPEHNFGLVVIENGGGANSKIAELVGRELIGRKLGISQDERRGEGIWKATVATELDPRESDASGHEGVSGSSTSVLPSDFDPTVTPGIYEHKAYGRIKISLAQSAALQTQTPTIDGERLIRSLPQLPHDQVTETNTKTTTPTYLITFLGLRSFLPSFLLHPPSTPPTDPPSHTPHDPNSTSTTAATITTFFTLENLWPHGDLQSDPIPNLPKGHGTPDDPKHPFKQESVYESQSFMDFGACFEVVRDGDGNGDGEGLRFGLVLGRTESSEFRGRKGRDRERLVEGWRRKMVWFGRVEEVR